MTVKKLGNGYWLLRFQPLSIKLHPLRMLLVTSLALALLALSLLALVSGSGPAGWKELLALASNSAEAAGLSIIGDLRLPRTIMALSCGAMLGLSGAALQSLTRNGLADPGLLGVREGAVLVIVSAIIAFPHMPVALRPLLGMAGGFAVAVAIALIAGSLSRMRFVLIGIGFSWLLSAAITMLITVSDIDRVQIALTWMAGSLASVTPEMVPIALTGLLAGSMLMFATARWADVSLLGDSATVGLGVPTKALVIIRLCAPVLMTATAVSCVGGIGFVGLIAPHAARITIGGGQKSLLSGSMFIGAALLAVSDTVGRTAFAPLQIPAGIVLAIIGVPVLLLLLWHRRDQL
ncbi:FecCD family ABC transporter permease [Agrobacterium larrymoorei]|uniref:Iron ABC transporter permease n=1 Tax=Agrobacterium larrymoorei TaxID=160699 RepID=A0A4D7DPD0_9HYPH|nr:iron ABC transporter permease [Agrobacterium larrymoorei]QCI99273.1 iron ABC transporter permease [Agrobacterium larrymoorei]QYA08809.1 iron ABC transporter permease [Agrobacterium larrymoorei]